MEITRVDERIKLPIPPNLKVTTRSTPVIWFGNYEQAKVCTISINPSDNEFYRHPKGQDDYVILDNLLKNRFARLCSREELRKNDDDPLDDNDVTKIRERCNNYFGRNPYRAWFDAFEHFLRRFGGYSYYDGTCVHLDMVQWSTTPIWSELLDDVQEKHLKNDLPILKHLLEKDFETMFLNGESVVENVSEYLNVKLSVKTAPFNNKTLKISIGEYNRTKVIGWNLPLQYSSFANIDILCDLIKKNI